MLRVAVSDLFFERVAQRRKTRSRRRRDAHLGDRIFHWILKGFGWSVILTVGLIFLLLLKMAWPVLSLEGRHFVTGDDWNPPQDIFGALPFIYGTLMSSLIALAMAVPVSLGVAIFLNELAPRSLARTVGFLVEMLAAIPSVVYGLWGIFILSPFMQQHVQPWLSENLGPSTAFSKSLGLLLTILAYPFVLIGNGVGFSNLSLLDLEAQLDGFADKLFMGPGYGVGLLTASIVLAIMITPTISAITREVFATVNSSIKEAALALGATRWEMIRMAVLKTARSGILGAVILGLGRALGETLAVTMVIGNRNEITAKLLSGAQTMASVIANEYPEASGLHLAGLAGVGLALFAVSLIVNATARFIIWRVEKGSR